MEYGDEVNWSDSLTVSDNSGASSTLSTKSSSRSRRQRQSHLNRRSASRSPNQGGLQQRTNTDVNRSSRVQKLGAYGGGERKLVPSTTKKYCSFVFVRHSEKFFFWRCLEKQKCAVVKLQNLINARYYKF